MNVYLGDWKCASDVASDFVINESTIADTGEILLAAYDREGYSGSAFVLLTRDGVLYEVSASHCSCYGLEDQWEPEETTKAAVIYQLDEGYIGRQPFADTLRTIMAGLPGP